MAASHFKKEWVLLNHPEFRSSPGQMKVPNQIQRPVMYKSVPGPRSMAPGYLDEEGTYRMYVNKRSIAPGHRIENPHAEGVHNTTPTAAPASPAATVPFGTNAGSPRGVHLRQGTAIHSSPRSVYGSVPGYTATGVPKRTKSTSSSAGASTSSLADASPIPVTTTPPRTLSDDTPLSAYKKRDRRK